jgi:hypothetical protein
MQKSMPVTIKNEIPVLSHTFTLKKISLNNFCKPEGRVLMRWIFSNLPNPSLLTIALGSTQPLKEMSTRNVLKENPGGKVQPVRTADNLAAIY